MEQTTVTLRCVVKHTVVGHIVDYIACRQHRIVEILLVACCEVELVCSTQECTDVVGEYPVLLDEASAVDVVIHSSRLAVEEHVFLPSVNLYSLVKVGTLALATLELRLVVEAVKTSCDESRRTI